MMAEERYVRAIHEAAHAFMFTEQGVKVVDCGIHAVDKKEIVDRHSCTITGYTNVTELPKAALNTIFSLVLCTRVGFDAACRVDVEQAKKDVRMDEIQIHKYFGELKLPKIIRTVILDESQKESFALLDQHFGTVEKIAARLVEKGKLDGGEVRAIIQSSQTPDNLCQSSG
jgi:hypothetical protein